jgi:hypothetical protein
MSDEWRWVAASCIGTSHLKHALPKQDAFKCFTLSKIRPHFFAVVCDGAGSARWGGVGAWITSRVIARRFYDYLNNSEDFPGETDIATWIVEIRDYLLALAKLRNAHVREFSTTMIVVLTDGARTLTAHIGDGCVVGRDRSTSRWESLSWPQNGEYVSTTNFITEMPTPQLKFSMHENANSDVAVFSDGLECIALDLKGLAPFAPFFDGMFAPLRKCRDEGDIQALTHALTSLLTSDKVNARTDDDKTLILASLKSDD